MGAIPQIRTQVADKRAEECYHCVGMCVEAATTVGSDGPGQYVAFPVGVCPAMPVCAATPPISDTISSPKENS